MNRLEPTHRVQNMLIVDSVDYAYLSFLCSKIGFRKAFDPVALSSLIASLLISSYHPHSHGNFQGTLN